MNSLAGAASSARPSDGLSAVPLFSQMGNDRGIAAYKVPLTLKVSVHKFIFSFHMGMNGRVHYTAPANVAFDGKGVPKRFKSLFGELGTPLTWCKTYNLHVVSADPIHHQYVIAGVPRARSSQVQRLVIDAAGPSSPILATWTVRGGWSVKAAIQEQRERSYMLPKHAALDIAGHGYKIHTDMLYGKYAVSQTKEVVATRT